MKFSIIIPVYNVAPYLCACLDSVLAQTYVDWEAICVDDGSTDGCGAILDEYAAKDARFKVVHQKNAGVSVARNRGMSRSTGEVFGFVDGDDFVARNLLSEVNCLFEKEQPDLVRIRYHRYQGSKIDEQPNCSHQVLNDPGIIAEWAVQTLPEEGEPWLNFIKRVRATERFPEDVQIGEDMLFIMGTIKHCTKIVKSKFKGYYYRDNPSSVTRWRLRSEERVNFFRRFKDVVESYQGHGGRLSWAAWFSLASWILRPQDMIFRNELHSIFSELVEKSLIDVSTYPHYARLCCRIYVRTGLLWPVRWIYSLVMAVVKSRDSLRRWHLNVRKEGH